MSDSGLSILRVHLTQLMVAPDPTEHKERNLRTHYTIA
jgi:hypothetical protein